jgi:hypothetical protein
MVVAFQAFQLLRDAGLQPHHVTAVEQVARLYAASTAPAPVAINTPLRWLHFVDGAFALAKARLALDLEHGAHVHTALVFDLLIEIDERQAIMHGKATPDGRLAGAGRADDEQVA